MYAANTAPTGWLECSGAAVSRTTYAGLFTAIGTVFGVGDGSTTFNLPDMRGEFARGWDNSRGIDPARAFGSAQGQAIEAHTHTLPVYTNTGTGTGIEDGDTTGSLQTVSSGSTGGTETRPRNIALMFIIKF
jgi:microcystin-dependent protein